MARIADQQRVTSLDEVVQIRIGQEEHTIFVAVLDEEFTHERLDPIRALFESLAILAEVLSSQRQSNTEATCGSLGSDRSKYA